MAEGDERAAPERDENDRHRRGLRFRKREDHAVELFTEAREHLDDPARVDRVLIQLGRFYNPLLDQPIVDLSSRRRVLDALAAGDSEEARRLLDERLARYLGGTARGPA